MALHLSLYAIHRQVRQVILLALLRVEQLSIRTHWPASIKDTDDLRMRPAVATLAIAPLSLPSL